MKPFSITLIAIATLIIGFIAGNFFSGFYSKQKMIIKKEDVDYLTRLHDSYRNDLKRASVGSDTILNKIGPLIDDGTILSKGKASNDPIKKLLLESYECISGNMAVIRGYEQIYPQDSAFLIMYAKIE
jgi:hypothetical protein